MYQVFNMGHRLEIFTTAKAADAMIRTASAFGIAAQVVGRVETGTKKELFLHVKNETIVY